MIRLSFDGALAALKRHHDDIKRMDMREAFALDRYRFPNFSRRQDDLVLDWSKCAVNEHTMRLLGELTKAARLDECREAMFSGAQINVSEQRAVLHTVLRDRSTESLTVDGHNVLTDIQAVLERMAGFAEGVRTGALTGSSGKPFSNVVNIGIGGSDLGPAMATLALSPYHDGPELHFVSNIDSAHIADTLDGLDPETTLFIVASKTFTTVETMTNAATARDWLTAALGRNAAMLHFAAISTAHERVREFGISSDRVFGFWDWVGGRYSLWSAIGLPLMIAIGAADFSRFLDGGNAMDDHFRQTETGNNLPVLLGQIGYCHRVMCGYPSRAIIPYDQRLARFPAYLQQLDMESNGKSVTMDGSPVTSPTGPLVWGEPGTNGQHAFFQWLHQGTDIVPVEFVAAVLSHEAGLEHHQDLLLANFLAQSQALLEGRSLQETNTSLSAAGLNEQQQETQAPHRVFPGNRPSVTILYRKLDPFTLGRLVALYEHRVFVESLLFHVNAFDQWGVELGKELATALLPAVRGDVVSEGVSAGLVETIRQLRDCDARD